MFVTASGTELILQFGVPALPTLGSKAVSGFTTNRFSGPGTGAYVIDNNYSFTLNYTLDPTNTFVSGALISTVNGTEVEVDTDVVNDGTLNFNINGTAYETYLHSGSHTFYGSLCVQLADGSTISVDSGNYSGTTLSKSDPGDPAINLSYSLTGGTSFISDSDTNDYDTSNIEEGVTGTITFTTTGGSTNGWTSNGITQTAGSSSPITVTATGAISTLTVSESWDSNGLGTPITPIGGAQTRSKSYSRIISRRHGASISSSFSEAELQDLLNWEGGAAVESGDIVFGDVDPNGNTVSIDVTTTPKYIYIIYDEGQNDLTQIVQNQQNILNSFTKTVVGGYKVYKGPLITLLPTTFEATLYT